MSFLSDLFEGHTSHLGTDLSHAGSSLMHHPTEMLELGGAAALGAAPFLLPELGSALGVGGAAEGGGLFGGLGGLFGGGGEAAAAGGDALALAAPDAAASSPALSAIDAAIGGGGGVAPTIGEGAAVNAAGAAIDPLASSGGSAALSDAASIAGGAGVAPAGGSSAFMSSLNPANWTLGGIGKGLGVAAAGAGLGMNLLRGNQTDPNQQKLQDLAGQLGSQGQVLESYLKTGKLPPALQAQLDQAKASEKARIISGYAQRGQPTDPRLNSALAQDLNNVDTNAIAAMAQVQVEMLNTGLKETGMSMELYKTLTTLDEQQNKDLMQSIQNMAMALGGGGGAPARVA